MVDLLHSIIFTVYGRSFLFPTKTIFDMKDSKSIDEKIVFKSIINFKFTLNTVTITYIIYHNQDITILIIIYFISFLTFSNYLSSSFGQISELEHIFLSVILKTVWFIFNSMVIFLFTLLLVNIPRCTYSLWFFLELQFFHNLKNLIKLFCFVAYSIFLGWMLYMHEYL